MNEFSSYVLSFYPTCVLCKGAVNSLVIDLNRNKFYSIPNDMYNIIVNFSGYRLDLIFCEIEDLSTLHEYFIFLIEKELIIKVNSVGVSYKEISTDYYTPSHIDNIILDVDHNIEYNLKFVVSEINKLLCKDLQLRVFSIDSIDLLREILEQLMASDLVSIDLIIPQIDGFTNNDYISFYQKYSKVTRMIVHSAAEDELIFEDGLDIIYFTANRIIDSAHCGFIFEELLNVNINIYIESQSFNTCLNKKISIDVKGEIKNCPAMTKSYGSIKENSLFEVAQDIEFQKVWYIHKDQIKVCRDCEYRHICTDCRAFVEDPQDQYSKPLKCGYNPYTNEWEEWSANPLKQKSIEFYKLREFSK